MMYHKPGVDLNTFHCLFTNTANSLSSAHAHQSNIMTVHVLANRETSSPREMFYSCESVVSFTRSHARWFIVVDRYECGCHQ